METLKDAKLIVLVALVLVVSVCTWIFKSTMNEINLSVTMLNKSVSALATEVRVGSQANKINKESILELKTEQTMIRARLRELERNIQRK